MGMKPLENSRSPSDQAFLKSIQSSVRSPWQWLLDTSVFFSFDRSGALRHQKQAPQMASLPPQWHAVITGANSGLGKAMADQLMEAGGTVTLLCRSPSRAQKAADDLAAHHGRRPHVIIADVTHLEDIDQAADEFKEAIAEKKLPPINCLVHNAGFLPLSFELGTTGHELSFAAHLIGPTRLTSKLLEMMAPNSRIIWVSSGGMYFAPLDIDRLLISSPPQTFDGVFTYALGKRAQVELARIMHRRLAHRGIDVQSTHPGWADTPGVARSLASFHRKMGGRLRSPHEGAAAMSWLCTVPPLSQSHFWFDWAPRSPYLLGKRPTPTALDALWAMVCDGAGLSPDWGT